MFGLKLIKKLRTSFDIVLSHNKNLLCHTMGGKTVIYDTNSWEKVIELPKPNNPDIVQFSADDKILYIKNTVGTICVFDITQNFTLIKTIKSRKSLHIEEGRFELLEAPFTIIDVLKIKEEKQVCILNIETGKFQQLTDLEGTHIELNQFLPNENAYLFTLFYLKEINGEHYLRRKLVKVKNPLIEPTYTVIQTPLVNWDLVYFEPVHQVYFFVQDDFTLTIMDSELKMVIREESLLDKGIENKDEYFVHIATSGEGKYLVLTTRKRVLILRIEDLKPICNEELEYACFAEFSAGDKFLLVGTWSKGFVFENSLSLTP